MQNMNDVRFLYEMIQSKEKLKVVENYQKNFQNSNISQDQTVVTSDEQEIIRALHVLFEGEIICTQYCIERKRLDAQPPKYKAGIEVNKYDHEGGHSDYE